MALKEYKPGTAFTGVIGRTFDVSEPAWPEPLREEGPQRLVHRAGRHRLRPDGLLWQPDQDAEHRCAGGQRTGLQQHAHHGAVLAHQSVHLDRAQSSLERDVMHHRGFHRVPGRQRLHPVRERHAVGDPAPKGLQHLRPRQVAPDAGGSDFGGGTVPTVGHWAAASSATTGSSAATPISSTRN